MFFNKKNGLENFKFLNSFLMQLLQTKITYVSKLVFQTCSLPPKKCCEKIILKLPQGMCKIIYKIIIEGGCQLFTANLEDCMEENPLTFVLRLILFSIFITDLPYEIWMMLIKFADA